MGVIRPSRVRIPPPPLSVTKYLLSGAFLPASSAGDGVVLKGRTPESDGNRRVRAVVTIASRSRELRPASPPPAPRRFVSSGRLHGRAGLFTIGYGRHRTPESFVETLTAAGVERLVDVRELPLSRRRYFSKTALSALLAEAGIEYVHMCALDNPKPYRDLYRPGRQEEGEALCLAHLRNGAAVAVDRLSAAVGERPTCVLCDCARIGRGASTRRSMRKWRRRRGLRAACRRADGPAMARREVSSSLDERPGRVEGRSRGAGQGGR
jgi:hypothetical protein